MITPASPNKFRHPIERKHQQYPRDRTQDQREDALRLLGPLQQFERHDDLRVLLRVEAVE